MVSAEVPSASRSERRRAATRQALIGAARQILAETGDTSVSIQSIAERADVGFGSFYNHFASKTELFDAAVADVLDELGRAFDDRLSSVSDPAELLVGGFRLSARMADTHPEVMQIVRRSGLAHVHSGRGLAPRAMRDIEHGVSTGRFTQVDPIIALSTVAGALLGLIELRFARPDVDGDEAAIGVAQLVLQMLGLKQEDAGEVARRPLPLAT